MDNINTPFYIDTFADINPINYLISTGGLSPETIEFSMEALDFVLNALPKVRVEEKEGIVQVGGFWAKDLSGDIHKTWGSKRIVNSIFLSLNARSLTFHSFFVVEVLYILEFLKGSPGRKANISIINSLMSAIYENTWLKEAQARAPKYYDPSLIRRRMTYKPLKVQEDFMLSYTENVPKLNLNGAIMAAPPGTGKTLAGYFLGCALDKEVQIFIVPKPATHEIWETTLKQAFKKEPKYWISTDKADPKGNEDIIICHYQSIERIMDFAHRNANKDVMVWLDESHNLNTWGSLQTQKFIKLCKTSMASDIIWASGTPLKAIGSEAIPVLTTIDPLFTEAVRTSFVGIFGSTKGRALDIFAHRLSKIMFKPEKSEIVTNESEDYTLKLQPTTWKEYTLEAVREKVRLFIEERIAFYKEDMVRIKSDVGRWMGIIGNQITDEEEASAYKLYKSRIETMHNRFDPFAHKEWMSWCKALEKRYEQFLDSSELKAFRKEIAAYKYVALVIRGEALGRVVTKARMDAVKSLVPLIPWKKIISEAEKKTLVFTSYVPVLEATVDHLNTLGFTPVSVYGENSNELVQTKEKLRKDPKINPIVATFKSLATAVEVTECNVEVFIDVPFRDYIYQQARGRIDRVGQNAKLHYITILMDTADKKNITDRSLDIMSWSKDMVDAMMGLTGIDAITVESIDGLLGVYGGDALDQMDLYSYEVPELTRKDIWYQNLLDIPTSYFKSGVRYAG